MGFTHSFLPLVYAAYLLFSIAMMGHQQENSVVCGMNSYPFSNGTCTCLPGFHFLDYSNQTRGCHPNLLQQLSCNTSGLKMEEFERINWPGNDYEIIINTNGTRCSEACMEDCVCAVAIYNGNQQKCWKKSMPVLKGQADDTSIAFVKVYMAAVPVSPSPVPTVAVPPMAAPPPVAAPPVAVPPSMAAAPVALSPTPLPSTPPKEGNGEKGMPPSTRSIKQRKEGKEKGKALIAIGITLLSSSFVFAAILSIIWLYTCRPKLKAFQEHQKFDQVGLRAFSFQEIDTATRGFKEQIGRGAFGKVYKGVLSDRKLIAVKKLDKQLFEAQRNGEQEFRSEMTIIGASHHKNLVKLYGFCHEGLHRMLVYEYMPNRSLDRVLFKATRVLDWDVRFNIGLGTARGILYLHEECTNPIIHCDIKPQNILLDENYNAKIADFGISKLIGEEQTRTYTLARGTVGYMAPEWKRNIGVTVKVDVYSFGVMLLETSCCRKMFESEASENEMVLSDLLYDCYKCGKLGMLMEHQNCRGVDATQLERMVLVGLWCIQGDYRLRPSMRKVVQMLEGVVDVTAPPDPGSYS